jgi:hypothetical protein
VSILDFGLTGSIQLIFPRFDASERLGPGERIATGSLELFVPEESRNLAGPEREPAEAGVETAKLFASTYPTDFGALIQQDGMRGVKSSMGEATMLWELLDMALTGFGSRRSRPVQLPTEQDWITVERVFAVRRKGWR